MDSRMPERHIATLISKIIEYWDALLAVCAGIFGGTLAYLSEVNSGARRWSMAAFTLSTSSAGFFAFIAYMVCLDLFNWTPGLSVAAAGMVAHMGAEKVRDLLTNFFLRKFQ